MSVIKYYINKTQFQLKEVDLRTHHVKKVSPVDHIRNRDMGGFKYRRLSRPGQYAAGTHTFNTSPKFVTFAYLHIYIAFINSYLIQIPFIFKRS